MLTDLEIEQKTRAAWNKAQSFDEIRALSQFYMEQSRDQKFCTTPYDGGPMSVEKRDHIDTLIRLQSYGIIPLGGVDPTGIYWEQIDGEYVHTRQVSDLLFLIRRGGDTERFLDKIKNADGAQTRCASSGSQPFEGADSASLPNSYSRDDRNEDKPTKRDAPQRNPMSQKTRCGKKVQSRARSRLQKKSASVSRHQAYAFDRLGGARRAASGAIEYQVYWAPTWLPLDHFERDDAVEEAKDLAVNLFSSDAWQKEAQRLGLRL